MRLLAATPEPARDTALRLRSLLLDRGIELVDLSHCLLARLFAVGIQRLPRLAKLVACLLGLALSVHCSRNGAVEGNIQRYRSAGPSRWPTQQPSSRLPCHGQEARPSRARRQMRDPLGEVSMPSYIRRFASSWMWEWVCSWLTLELFLCYFRITT